MKDPTPGTNAKTMVKHTLRLTLETGSAKVMLRPVPSTMADTTRRWCDLFQDVGSAETDNANVRNASHFHNCEMSRKTDPWHEEICGEATNQREEATCSNLRLGELACSNPARKATFKNHQQEEVTCPSANSLALPRNVPSICVPPLVHGPKLPAPDS